MLGMLNFLLIQLDFESYFIKLIYIQGHVSLHSGACLELHLVPKPQQTFAPCAFNIMLFFLNNEVILWFIVEVNIRS